MKIFYLTLVACIVATLIPPHATAQVFKDNYQRQITGTVCDAQTNETLPGVNVFFTLETPFNHIIFLMIMVIFH